jgi:hypothetical protein
MTETELYPPLLPLGHVPRLPWLPPRRGGSRLNIATAYRWATRGVLARDGATRVRLRVVRVGDVLCTADVWLREFFDALTNHDPALATDTSSSAPAVRTPTQRRRAAERAAAELEKVGI